MSGRGERLAVRAVHVVPVAAILVLGWQHRWMSDDGFINLRVVENVVAGNGPVFNVGERVEASTSPLWVMLLAVVEPITGVALPWKAVLLGIGFTALGLAGAQASAVALGRGRDGTAVVPLGAFVVVALRPFWDFASSGLETGMSFAWIGASCWWTARRVSREDVPSPRAELAGAVLLGLGWLIRPDLALFSAAFGAVLLAALWDASRRRRWAAIAAFVAVPALGQILRMGYYAMLVPNTALAKEAGVARWGQGWRYLINLVQPYWLWVPLVLIVAVLVWRTQDDLRAGRQGLQAAARLAPAVAGVLHGAYVLRAGGDFMHARLLLPSLFGIVAPVGVPLPAPTRGGLRERAPSVVVLAVVAVWVAVVLARPPSLETLNRDHIEDERALYQSSFGRHPIRIDLDVARGWDKGPWLPVRDDRLTVFSPQLVSGATDLETGLPVRAAAVPAGVGAGSYAMELDEYSIDIGGLGHPIGSHLDMLVGERMGHQKWMPVAWQVAGMSPAQEVRSPEGELLATREEVRAAHEAVSCGRLDRYLQDIQDPLTPGRFLGNVVDSFANTLFRIPPDPEDAVADLCG